MMRRLIAIAGWLMLGHAAVGGLFWALLHVPESNVAMVTLSAFLVVLAVTLAAEVEALAVAGWTSPAGAGGRLRYLVRAVPALVAALAPFALLYWLTGSAEAWLAAHRGEVDAWLIRHARLVNSAWLHTTVAWILWVVRYVVGVSVGVAIFAAALELGARGFGIRRWAAPAFRPRTLILVACWLLVLVWLPWQAVYWRPRLVPPSWLEVAFVSTKLLVLYAAANLGWALVLRTGTSAATSPRST